MWGWTTYHFTDIFLRYDLFGTKDQTFGIFKIGVKNSVLHGGYITPLQNNDTHFYHDG